jgi:hypothetical protein
MQLARLRNGIAQPALPGLAHRMNPGALGYRIQVRKNRFPSGSL